MTAPHYRFIIVTEIRVVIYTIATEIKEITKICCLGIIFDVTM